MGKEKVREWVREKLQDGHSESQLKDVVEDEGYNPELVEEVSEDISGEKAQKAELGEAEQGSKEDSVNNGFEQEFDVSDKDNHEVEDDIKEDNKSNERVEDENKSDNSFIDEESSEEKAPDTKDVNLEIFDTAEKIEDISSKLQREVGMEKKPVFAVLLLIGLISLVGAYVSIQGVVDIQNQQGPEENINKANKSPSSLPEDFEGVKVELKNGKASPGRATVNQSEKVAFLNQESYDLNFTTEDGEYSSIIGSESLKIYQFDSIGYYSAKPFNATGETIRGSVYVE